MRNKIFAIVFSAIFLFMLVGAPLTLVLTKYGILEYNNVGNQIVADKTYDESTAFGKVFTAIENGKVAIKDTYINNLPFFLKITNAYKPFKSNVDQPVINWLQEKGNASAVYMISEIDREDMKLKQFDYMNEKGIFDYKGWTDYMETSGYTCEEE